MPIAVNREDVELEIQRDYPRARATIDPPTPATTVVTTIDNPQLKFVVNKESLLEVLGDAVPDLAGAITLRSAMSRT